uniref:D-isomer specific 2-hydroxyacid dehydrogenase catalytic domain-containing protein n=1 Tax=Panagrolaimus sp. JU765 TaxID=591449 RepID=A0AC34QQ85_9BILA
MPSPLPFQAKWVATCKRLGTFEEAAEMIQIKSVLIADDIEQECVDALTANKIRVEKKTKQTEEQLCKLLKEFDAVIVRSATKITSKILEASAGHLKLVGRAGTGVDNIDVPAATRNGVIVMNTPGWFGFLLTVFESIRMFCKKTRKSLWPKAEAMVAI